jgi:SAM-dependent methyltransferase
MGAGRLRPSTIPEWPRAFDRRLELDWSDAVVSRRLLLEHLDQDHDGASRRLPVVERQVRRLLRLLPPSPAQVLDAACGPGLYAVRLARRGHHVVGVDVGPAVLRHARALARACGVPATFAHADLRQLEFVEAFDAVVLIYYVLEGFPRGEQERVLRRLARALRPGGRIIAELRVRPDQPPGRITAWDVVPRSLLSDRPHLLLTDTTYDDRRQSYVLREVAVFDDGAVRAQQTTGRLIRLADVPSLCGRAGLTVRAVYDGWTRFRATALSESLLVVAERPSRPRAVRARRRPSVAAGRRG